MNYVIIVILLAFVNWFPTFGSPILIRGSVLLKAFPDDIEGFTFGRFVVTRENSPSNKLISHELIHVKQYKEYGVIVFLVCYYGKMLCYFIDLKDIDKSYKSISFEVEAYEKQLKE